jgi:glycosyltransferase involved in cell wall biosynthesis
MKTLTVIVPFFNESRTLQKLVQKLEPLYPGTINEVLFVNDGSIDDSTDVLNESMKYTKINHKILNKKNEGKTSAVKYATSYISSTHVIILDADLELDPSDIIPMWKIVEQNISDEVFGYRVFKSHSSFTYRYSMGNKIISHLYGILFNQLITDIMCGFKLIRTEIFKSIKFETKKFGIEIEIPIRLWNLNLRPYEIEVSYSARSRAEGKSISILDAMQIISNMIYFRIKN